MCTWQVCMVEMSHVYLVSLYGGDVSCVPGKSVL